MNEAKLGFSQIYDFFYKIVNTSKPSSIRG